MTELLFGLLVMSAIILFGIAIYNYWQLKQIDRNHKKAFETTQKKSGSKLRFLSRWFNQHTENFEKPELDSDDEDHLPIAVESPDLSARQAPASSAEIAHRMIEGIAQMEQLSAEKTLSAIDERIDFTIEIFLPFTMSGSKLMPWIKRVRLVGKKPVMVDASQDGKHNWELLRQNRLYKSIRLGLQLTNRSGPLNPIELNEFQAIVSQITKGLGADHYWMASPQKILERAKQLDQLTSQLDATIVLIVPMVKKISLDQLDKLLSQHQLRRVLDYPLWHMPDLMDATHTEPIFTVNLLDYAHNTPAPEAIQFKFEIAKVNPDYDAYSIMIRCAKAIANALGSQITNQQYLPLTDEHLLSISDQLNAHYEQFAQLNLRPGEKTSLRLFS